MKLDSLKQFSRLRNTLAQERTALEERLGQINDLLGPLSTSNHRAIRTLRRRVRRRARGARGGRRRRGGLSLKQAIIKATRAKPLTKDEILAAVKQMGVKFATARPMASVNAYLYQKGQFKRRNGRLAPGKAAR